MKFTTCLYSHQPGYLQLHATLCNSLLAQAAQFRMPRTATVAEVCSLARIMAATAGEVMYI